MEISTDPYEQKLYQMFQSYDTNGSGTLDETALQSLCRSLELQDQGSVLIRSLIKTKDGRVTFKDFKEELLNFLGTAEATDEVVEEKSLVISDDIERNFDSPPEASDREVLPKFVVGSKKYGRRSRPQSLATDSTPSDSDDPETVCVVPTNTHASQVVHRSSSQSDIPSNRRRRPLNTGGTKLKRCASLPAQRNQKSREQHKLLKKQQQQQTQNQMTSSVESLDVITTKLETIPSHSIIEMWERALVPDAKLLLTVHLGFDDDEINIAQLTKVLEEELRGLEDDVAQSTLLKALLSLQKAEISALQQTFRHLLAENKKLHLDNKDANRRAAMLAQEIDERHATLEDATKAEIRSLEQRHAEALRDLTTQMANDRENWSSLHTRLEARIKSLAQDETKLKADVQSLQTENSALETEQAQLQKQIADLLEQNIQLNNEIAELEDRTRTDDGSKGEQETEEVLELIEKITSLQVENANLRDKNDELVAEVEGLSLEISRSKSKKGIEVVSDDPEHSSLGVKRRGDSPSKTRITEESPRLGKFRKCSNDVNSESETSGDWVALNAELSNPLVTPTSTSGFSQDFSSMSDSKDEMVKSLKEKITKLESEIQELKEATPVTTKEDTDESTLRQEKETLEGRCKELEASLEQMRKAYEDCEDYWQAKLTEERQLFDKERQIYEDEQQESDKKFTELMEKVREYEEQFSKDGRLSPIEEKDTLEQQYADLEAEAEELREKGRALFAEKTKEIEGLQAEIQVLRLRLQENEELFNESSNYPKHQHDPSDMESPASSPISYLWNQSTIQSPVKGYEQMQVQQTNNRANLPTSGPLAQSESHISPPEQSNNISPIQKPNTAAVNQKAHSETTSNKDGDDNSSTTSHQSFESPSVASTHSVHKSSVHEMSSCSSPNGIKEELKRLKYFEVQLKEQIKDLALKRDSLVMELQQLQEAKPVLEKAYARAAHPTLIQRVNQLELKNRHLQNVIKQQQQYTESLMQQTWQQKHAEITELHNRIEAQGIFMAEQAQRLANADVLVKDLYVENSHLTASIQLLEQQRSRANLLQQHQGHHPGLSGVLPGMP